MTSEDRLSILECFCLFFESVIIFLYALIFWSFYQLFYFKEKCFDNFTGDFNDL